MSLYKWYRLKWSDNCKTKLVFCDASSLAYVCMDYLKVHPCSIPKKWDPGTRTSTGGTPGPGTWNTKMSRRNPGSGTQDPKIFKWDWTLVFIWFHLKNFCCIFLVQQSYKIFTYKLFNIKCKVFQFIHFVQI